MRCHICDQVLGETEIKFNRQCDEWEPCGSCLAIIGEVFEDTVPEDELVVFVEENEPDLIDEDFP